MHYNIDHRIVPINKQRCTHYSHHLMVLHEHNSLLPDPTLLFWPLLIEDCSNRLNPHWPPITDRAKLERFENKCRIILGIKAPVLKVIHCDFDFVCKGHAQTDRQTLMNYLFNERSWRAVWPELAIFCTLGSFIKPFATMNLPKSLTFLGNFCKGVKIYHFSSEILFGQLL